MKIKCTKAAWNSLKYSVPVSVLLFSAWLVSLVSIGYLFEIYDTVYNVSSETLGDSPQQLNVCIAYITDDIMRTYLIPQWLLVFFLPITIAIYILAMATDHWLPEVFSCSVTCFSITCCGAVVFLLGQNLVLISRGSCNSRAQFLGSITGFVGNGLCIIFLTLSLALISIRKRCSTTTDFKPGGQKAAVMAEIKHNLPIEMRVNDLYGLSHSVTNIPQGVDDGFGTDLYRHRSQISVYEDVP